MVKCFDYIFFRFTVSVRIRNIRAKTIERKLVFQHLIRLGFFHYVRNLIILLKNNFNLKAISKILGHAKEIVTADIYINNQDIIADGVTELKDYLKEVLPEDAENYIKEEKVYDHSDFDVTEAFKNSM